MPTSFATARPLLKTHGRRSGRTARAPIIRASTARSTRCPAIALTPSERAALTIEDRALYIYTSGTTGLPKAANINHYRVMLASCAFAGVMDTQPTDRMYDCLPMYHTAGGAGGDRRGAASTAARW